MQRFFLVCLVAVLAAGVASAQETSGTQETPGTPERTDPRFEISAESGLTNMLSGPDIKEMSNFAARIGFMPSANFQLTLMYAKFEGTLASDDDVLGGEFIAEYRDTVNSETNFQDAVMDVRDIEYEQIEFGLVKSIPLDTAKKWESYIGVGVGFQHSSGEITWIGATRQGEPVDAALSPEEDAEFFTSVRGGLRWIPLRWLGLQLNLRLVPIGKVLDADYNSLELNGGLVFRFGSI